MAVRGREGSRLAFGVFPVNVDAGELLEHGTRVRLEDRPFQLLVALLNRPGDVVPREELRERLWPDGTFVDFDHNLSSADRHVWARSYERDHRDILDLQNDVP